MAEIVKKDDVKRDKENAQKAREQLFEAERKAYFQELKDDPNFHKYFMSFVKNQLDYFSDHTKLNITGLSKEDIADMIITNRKCYAAIKQVWNLFEN